MGSGRHDHKVGTLSYENGGQDVEGPLKGPYVKLDSRQTPEPGNGHALIAADILSDPDRERAVAELRKMVLRNIKLLDKDGAVIALERLLLALEQPASGHGVVMARIHDLGLRLVECAAEQGMDIKENICETLSKQPDPESAHECLRRYLVRLIDENKRLTDKSSRHGALAVEFIKEHYTRPDLSIKDMTSLLSVSGSYFSAMFKNYTGVTFTEFLARLRIDKARELLLGTDKKNYEIAAAVGYDDPGYFRQIFKKHTNLSPSEFRRINAG